MTIYDVRRYVPPGKITNENLRREVLIKGKNGTLSTKVSEYFTTKYD